MKASALHGDLDRFLALVSENWDAYKFSGLSYHAKKIENNLIILHARLFLDINPSWVTPKIISFLDQEIGFIPLENLSPTGPDIIRYLVNGTPIKIPTGELSLPLTDGIPAIITFQPLHELGMPAHRLSVLTITGAPYETSRFSRDLDWEIKGNNPPYDSLNELLTDCRLAQYSGDFSCIEIPASHLAEVDMQSIVSGTSAEPGVVLAMQVDKSYARLGVIIYQQGKAVSRSTFSSEQLEWTTDDSLSIQRGRVKVTVPTGATIKCFASYREIVQNMGWIGDPSLFPNWKRTVYDSIDPQCEVLQDALFETKKERFSSQDFESGVASLLWMLGFSPTHIINKRLTDNSDIYVTTPKGRMILGECTTSVIDKDGKLAKLHARAQSIRDRLERSGASFLELLPVLFTPLAAKDVIDLDKATKSGILVLTREDLKSAFERSFLFQDPDLLFDEQQQVLEARQRALVQTTP